MLHAPLPSRVPTCSPCTASGSGAMLAAAREGVEQAAAETGGERARLVAITVLTSMDEQALAEVGITCPIPDEAARLAGLARANGIDGIVCSPREAAAMRQLLGEDALIVTPGVRPAGAALGDQSRVATPAAAIASGASHLVIGRPITGADRRGRRVRGHRGRADRVAPGSLNHALKQGNLRGRSVNMQVAAPKIPRCT